MLKTCMLLRKFQHIVKNGPFLRSNRCRPWLTVEEALLTNWEQRQRMKVRHEKLGYCPFITGDSGRCMGGSEPGSKGN